MIKANFDPGELRIPTAEPHAGEWTASGGGGTAKSLRDGGSLDPESIAYQGHFHDAVVAYLKNSLAALGSTVIASVPLTAFDATTAIPDMIVKPVNEPPYILEVKTGEDPTFTEPQRVVYPLAQIGAHVSS